MFFYVNGHCKISSFLFPDFPKILCSYLLHFADLLGEKLLNVICVVQISELG